MRKVIAYFFLLTTLNVVLFHSMDVTGHRDAWLLTDPINSVTEFVMEVCLGIEDMQPGDEREAESDHSGFAKVLFSFSKPGIELNRINFFLAEENHDFCNCILLPEYHTVTSPPPESRC